MDIKSKALAQAVKTLQALECQFKVIAPDGTEYGELKVAAAPEKSRRRYRVFVDVYKDVLNAMQTGEVAYLNPPEGSTAEGLRSAVTGYANRRFGPNNYMTCVLGGRVQVLRLG